MSRQKKAAPTAAPDQADTAQIAQAMAVVRADVNETALASTQQDAMVRAVAAQCGYELPGDCTDPDLIQRDIGVNMRRSVEACLEMGRGLIVLKVACRHGDFLPRLEALQMDVNVAGKFMASARRFSNSSAPMNLLKAASNQSKLFELLVLSDGQVEELELLGQTGELKLDDIASMSQKELREALREERARLKHANESRDKQRALIDKLEMKVTSFETAPPDEQYAVLSDKALGVMRSARAQIDGLLRQACMHLKAHGDDRRAHDAFLSGLIAELEHALGALREEFSLPVPDDKVLRPWEKEADRVRREQQAARAGKQ